MTNESGTEWKDMVYIGIALLGYFAIKHTSLSQSEYKQVSLNSWKPMTKEEKLVLGIAG